MSDAPTELARRSNELGGFEGGGALAGGVGRVHYAVHPTRESALAAIQDADG